MFLMSLPRPWGLAWQPCPRPARELSQAMTEIVVTEKLQKIQTFSSAFKKET
jgi:hypothetical protein